MEEFFTACCGISYHRLVAGERIGFPTVNVQTEFEEPIVYGDVIDVQINVAKLGRTSLTLDYAIQRLGSEAVCVRSRQVHVAMDLDTRRPVEVPQFLREKLSTDI